MSNPTYDNVKRFGNLAVTAGVLSEAKGPVTSVQQGAPAAAQAMGDLLGRLKTFLEQQGLRGLDAVRQVVRLEGYVFARPEFTEHSQVLNGASQVLFQTFQRAPHKGRHTRVAVGASSLPNGAAVELSLWVELISGGELGSG